MKDLIGDIPEKQAKVVLTSLHGTSLPLASDILSELNYDNFVIEKEQSTPDGNFPTVAIANPEDEAVLNAVLSSQTIQMHN